ncbi:hypothetical protein [Prosthecobacter sp.]|uniref:hypothetical protein n=1 Tax=Prosthecobacter sp. TaxID=1965333 RepID=UPI00378439FE
MNLLAAKTGLTAPVAFTLGLLIVMYCGWACRAVLTGWERFRKRHPTLSRWGKASMGFPASRMGVLYGALSGMFIGILMIGSSLSLKINLPFDGDYLVIGFLLWILLGLSIALRDYFLHVDNSDNDNKDD